ncbi:TIGR04282 family arsenosugar biosynthesis glycosyltransferase [uncultured Planktomarina sp.]|uniref:TIGR04282 family arsenosugar biosynthesis glycosyltransferase n=1 Tax=uncultured Planktomarina sp. TaxID=1538529 RepID=UPI003260BAEA
MVKEPRPGRVKTRLGREIGMTAAAWWCRHQTRRLLRRLQDPRWELILSVAPDHEGLQSRVWPAHLPRMSQGSGDLGQRMKQVFDSLPPGPVCIIGADIPEISRHHVWKAFASLGPHEATFGPAPDGGYWLIGLKRCRSNPKGLFKQVRWSTAHALQDTLISLSDLRVARVDKLRDIDNANDLKDVGPAP